MSAPDTNVTKQSRKHKASLIGIALAVVLGGAAAVFYGFEDGAVESTAQAIEPAIDEIRSE